MKHFFKPSLCALLTAALTCSLLFAGCGKNTGTPGDNTKTDTEAISNQTQIAENTTEEASASLHDTEASSRSSAKETSTPVKDTEASSESSAEETSAPARNTEASSESNVEETSAQSSSKEISSQNSSETEAPSPSHEQEDWTKYSNESQGWGQGVNFNSKNQPEGSLSYQKKYGSYDAHFIGSDTDDKVIWLTLDEGYENGYTSAILDVLKEKNCQAVFFITGPYAEQNPDLVRRMIDEGHVVGNHSWSHPSKGMPSLSVEDQIADITRLHDYVKEHFNYEMTLFRNPAGIFSERSLAVTRSLGYDSMFWSFAYADWDPDKQPDPQTALQKLVDRLHPGALYLLHAVSETNTEILGDFIDQARSQGYEFKLP